MGNGDISGVSEKVGDSSEQLSDVSGSSGSNVVGTVGSNFWDNIG